MWLVGPPLFELSRETGPLNSVAPAQIGLARPVRAGVSSDRDLHRLLRWEYHAILDALLDAGTPFRILNLSRAKSAVAKSLRKKGYPSLDLPVEHLGSFSTYPRDLFLYAEAARLLLVHPACFRMRTRERRGFTMLPSAWAEGGRMVFQGDRAVLGKHPEMNRLPAPSALNRMRAGGMGIAAIPAAIFVTLGPRGAVQSSHYEPHIDRYASLVRDKRGAHVLLLDPGYRSGPLLDPWDVSRSLDAARRACARHAIEVRMPPKLGVPYGISLVAVANERYLMSSGDPDTTDWVASIVGRERLFVTSRPIMHYPVFASAGIHCLVTESPEALVA